VYRYRADAFSRRGRNFNTVQSLTADCPLSHFLASSYVSFHGFVRVTVCIIIVLHPPFCLFLFHLLIDTGITIFVKPGCTLFFVWNVVLASVLNSEKFFFGFGSTNFVLSLNTDPKTNILTRILLNRASHCYHLWSGTCTTEKKSFLIE
jgi:hypothetical protein